MKNLKLGIGSVTVRQPVGATQSPNALQHSLEANLARDLAQLQVSSSREAKVMRTRMPAASATSNIGAAISRAIVSALRKAP